MDDVQLMAVPVAFGAAVQADLQVVRFVDLVRRDMGQHVRVVARDDPTRTIGQFAEPQVRNAGSAATMGASAGSQLTDDSSSVESQRSSRCSIGCGRVPSVSRAV